MKITETFVFSDYELMAEEKSKIAKGRMHTVSIGLSCPHCGLSIRKGRPEHGEPFTCPRCFMRMTVFGNALECELEEER